MNIGVLRETDRLDHRVALIPQVVRELIDRGHLVWVETGAGLGAKFRDDEYIAVGGQVAYSAADVIRRCEVVVRISAPTLPELEVCREDTALLSFFHMAVAGPGVFQKLTENKLTAIGCEIIRTADGRLPVLAAVSEIAGQMTVSLAMHLLRSSSGGRGVLLGGSPGVPPARVCILGAGVVGTWAARTALATGASVAVLDTDVEKLRSVVQHLPNATTAFADPEALSSAVAAADVVIGAVLVAGARTPHVVTKQMVERMRPGSVIIDVAIDQGGCVATSRPTTIANPVFTHNGVVHYCVPNLTADMGRSTSIALAHALMPHLLRLADQGIEGALRSSPDLARGVYTYRGACVSPPLAKAWQVPCRALSELLDEA